MFRLTFILFLCISVGCQKNASPSTNSNATSNALNENGFSEKISVIAPKDAIHKPIYDLLMEDNSLDHFITEINHRIQLPEEVQIVVDECGEINAFYDGEQNQITMCYEFLDHTMSIQDTKIPEHERLLNSAAFTLLHEIGHAMVDKLDLPITGKEENAVDELAMIVLMSDTRDETFVAAIEGATQFYYDALEEDLTEFPYYDVHAPSIERYYDMLTIIVGAEPESTQDWVGEAEEQLHPDRAEFATAEYEQKLDAWQRILGDAWKQN